MDKTTEAIIGFFGPIIVITTIANVLSLWSIYGKR